MNPTDKHIRVTLIGAGNVGTQLGYNLKQSGCDIRQVWSAHLANAERLAERLGATATDRTEDLADGSDIYLYAVKDDALQDMAKTVSPTGGIHIHTAGAVSMDIFKGKKERYGVLYPMQTFSKGRRISFADVPIFIEASSAETETDIRTLAKSLSHTVTSCSSEERKVLHLAAVFCCNFPNVLYDIAHSLLRETSIPFETMFPLMSETIEKLRLMTPREAQTGPAVRGDEQAMARHLSLLEGNDNWQDIYRTLSQTIASLHAEGEQIKK